MEKANEGRLIEMVDGRKVTFGKVQKMRKEVMMARGVPTGIRFDGDDGGTFLADFADLPDAAWVQLAEPDAISVWAMAHGFSQKLGDSYAAKDSAEECIDTVRELWQRLCTGAWDSETRGFGINALLVEACMQVFGKGRDETKKILESMSATERLQLQVSDEVKATYDALLAKKAGGGDTAALKAKFQ